MANVFRDDVAGPSLDRSRPWPTPRTGTRNATSCPPCCKKDHDADRPHRHRAPGRFDRRTNLVPGTDAGLSRSDRPPRPSRAGLPAGRSSGGAGPSGRDRSPPGGRSTAGPPGRVAGGDQGRALHARRTDDLRVANPGELPPALRRHCDRPAEGGRCRADRQDEHGRVRHGRVERELGLSPHA